MVLMRTQVQDLADPDLLAATAGGTSVQQYTQALSTLFAIQKSAYDHFLCCSQRRAILAS
jgi:hypothetical protein